MRGIRLGRDEIKYIILFESLTGASVKDCIQNDEAVGFLVGDGDMGLAIGKRGSNVEKVRRAIGKSVWVMEFSDNPANFIKNLFQPVKVHNVKIQKTRNPNAVIEVSKRDRKKVIGHNGNRIKIAKKFAERHYEISNISVRVV